MGYVCVVHTYSHMWPHVSCLDACVCVCTWCGYVFNGRHVRWCAQGVHIITTYYVLLTYYLLTYLTYYLLLNKYGFVTDSVNFVWQ